MKTLPNEFIGESKSIRDIRKEIQKISQSDLTVLICGEPGAGKEVVARTIHLNSQRKTQPFIPVHCGAIQESLEASELFGHKKGSFTGAISDNRGLFETADGATLFLDEIGDMPPKIQAAVLRFLDYGEIRRVGDTRIIYLNVRIIAATNMNLENEIKEKRFRDDLYNRLTEYEIYIPVGLIKYIRHDQHI
jgi:transcriptional regulator with GAF, ATPase, and Fis domain